MTDYNEIKVRRSKPINEKDVQKEVDRVITQNEMPEAQPLKLKGVAKAKKPNLFSRTVTAIFPNGFKGVGEYLAKDVVLPAVKDLAWQAGNAALSMIIYRDVNHSNTNTYRYGGSGGWNTPSRANSNRNNRTNYSSAYGRAKTQAEQAMAPEDSFEDFVEFEFDNREDATYVFNKVDDWVSRYGRIPVAEYYRMVDPGIVTSYTMRSYGWNNLSGARIRPTRGGKYIIDFPPLVDLQI